MLWFRDGSFIYLQYVSRINGSIKRLIWAIGGGIFFSWKLKKKTALVCLVFVECKWSQILFEWRGFFYCCLRKIADLLWFFLTRFLLSQSLKFFFIDVTLCSDKRWDIFDSRFINLNLYSFWTVLVINYKHHVVSFKMIFRV